MTNSSLERFGQDVLQSLRAMDDNRYTRVPLSSQPPVVDYTSDQPIDLVPPGCIGVFFARPGSAHLTNLRQFVLDGDASRINELTDRLRRQFDGRQLVELREAVATVIQHPVYADLRYAGLTLAQNLHLPTGIDVGMLTLPYNGGELNDADFALVDYQMVGRDERLEALLVRRPPRMTDVVRAALARVPANQREINISDAAFCFAATCVIVAEVVVAIVVVTAIAGCAPEFERLERISLPEAEINQLGPVASARKLLDMRRRILLDMMA